jgi:hypothetical protein
MMHYAMKKYGGEEVQLHHHYTDWATAAPVNFRLTNVLSITDHLPLGPVILNENSYEKSVICIRFILWCVMLNGDIYRASVFVP